MVSSPERRLTAEWEILTALAACNPTRLTDPAAEDRTFRLRLRATPALPLSYSATGVVGHIVTEHAVRIEYPRFFPAAPMELYLEEAMVHPNIHPETGFVCVWDRHRVSNTAEHALHKTVAILGWRLCNPDAVHVMQPAALAQFRLAGETIAATLAAPVLVGLSPQQPGRAELPDPSQERRSRLS